MVATGCQAESAAEPLCTMYVEPDAVLKLKENTPLVTCGDVNTRVPIGGLTVTVTTEEVAEIPPAVAMAFKAYDPADRLLALRVNGPLVSEPRVPAFKKNVTLVTVPLLTVALAVMPKVAGAVKTALLVGLVMLTEGTGGGGGAVPRV